MDPSRAAGREGSAQGAHRNWAAATCFGKRIIIIIISKIITDLI